MISKKLIGTVGIRAMSTFKLSNEAFNSLISQPAIKEIQAAFQTTPHEIRICGGAVRDLLRGFPAKDIDFATTALPHEMVSLFTKLSWRMINNRGIKHGTITIHIHDVNYEITTLRIDRETTGRHAEVEFTKDWRVDAERRDLTFNSLFLDLDGTVYDYYGGADDLKNFRVRFVGDAKKRIQEDYLRILRYFRFFGRIAQDPSSHEISTLQIIEENSDGLRILSGERIASELRQIVSGRYAPQIMATMHSLSLFPYLWLPDDYPEGLLLFRDVYNRSQKFDTKPITLISALFRDKKDVSLFHERMKLSAEELQIAYFIVSSRDTLPDDLKSYQDIIVDAKSLKDFQAIALLELLKFKGCDKYIESLCSWDIPRFPVNGLDLKELGMKSGKHIGHVLSLARQKWKSDNYTTTKEELLMYISKISPS